MKHEFLLLQLPLHLLLLHAAGATPELATNRLVMIMLEA
jgi:hypothetical protein